MLSEGRLMFIFMALLIFVSMQGYFRRKLVCYVSSQDIFQIKANGKRNELFIAFIWACCGFFWSRGLERQPSGYEDEKECKRPKRADLAKTAQRQGRRCGYI